MLTRGRYSSVGVRVIVGVRVRAQYSRGTGTVACAVLDATSAGSRTAAKQAPAGPAAILSQEVRGQIETVAFKTVLG